MGLVNSFQDVSHGRVKQFSDEVNWKDPFQALSQKNKHSLAIADNRQSPYKRFLDAKFLQLAQRHNPNIRVNPKKPVFPNLAENPICRRENVVPELLLGPKGRNYT